MQITRRFVFPSDTSRGRNELLMLRAHLKNAKNCDFYLYEMYLTYISILFLIILENNFYYKIY